VRLVLRRILEGDHVVDSSSIAAATRSARASSRSLDVTTAIG